MTIRSGNTSCHVSIDKKLDSFIWSIREHNPTTKLRNRLLLLPFVRGIVDNMSMVGIMLINSVICDSCLIWAHHIGKATFSSDYRLAFIGIPMVLAMLLISKFVLGGVHAAEHMVINLMHSDGEQLSIKNVESASPVASQCGSMFAVCLFTIYFLMQVVSPFITLNILVAVSVGYEIWDKLSGTKAGEIIATMISKVVLRKPLKDEIGLAFVCMLQLNEALDKAEKID